MMMKIGSFSVQHPSKLENRANTSKTLKNVTGAWVQDHKVTVEDGKIAEYRVNLKVTFILKD